MVVKRLFGVEILIVLDFAKIPRRFLVPFPSGFRDLLLRFSSCLSFSSKTLIPLGGMTVLRRQVENVFFAPRKTGRFAYGLTDYFIRFSVDLEVFIQKLFTSRLRLGNWCFKRRPFGLNPFSGVFGAGLFFKFSRGHEIVAPTHWFQRFCKMIVTIIFMSRWAWRVPG